MMRPALRSNDQRVSMIAIPSAPTAGAARNRPSAHGPAAWISRANTGKSAIAPPSSTANQVERDRAEDDRAALDEAEAREECPERERFALRRRTLDADEDNEHPRQHEQRAAQAVDRERELTA